MKTVLSLVLVFLFVCVASAQPPKMEWKGKTKYFGDVDRLERPQGGKFGMGPGTFGDIQRMKPSMGWGPGKNKYGGPLDDGMRNWGGSPFRDFSPGRPWGRMGVPGGFGGPPIPFPPKELRGNDPRRENQFREVPDHSYHHGREWQNQEHRRNSDQRFQFEKRKLEGNSKVCPFCGVKIG